MCAEKRYLVKISNRLALAFLNSLCEGDLSVSEIQGRECQQIQELQNAVPPLAVSARHG